MHGSSLIELVANAEVRHEWKEKSERIRLGQRECDDVDNEGNICIPGSQFAVEGDDGLAIIG
jgi:hypothetical protein